MERPDTPPQVYMINTGSSMANCHNVNLYFNIVMMNFKTTNCFQNVSKVIEEYLKTLVFVHTISYGLTSKIVSYYTHHLELLE